MAGPLDDVISMLGSNANPPRKSGSDAAAAYLNDPKNRSAIMADASRIGAMRPQDNQKPATAAPAPTNSGPLDGAIDLLSSVASTPSAAAAPTPAIPPTINGKSWQAPGGLVMGVGDALKGGLETMLHAGAWLGDKIAPNAQITKDAHTAINQLAANNQSQEAAYQAARTKAGGSGMDLARMAGGIAGSTPLMAAMPEVGGAGLGGIALRGGIAGGANALMTPVADPAGNFASQKLGQVGGDALAGAALGPVASLAGRALQPVASAVVNNPLVSRLMSAPAAPTVAQRIEPTLAKPRVKLNVDGSRSVVSPVPAQMEAQASMLEQPAVAPTLSNATPELQAAVSNMAAKGQPVNPDVLQRHVEADSLPVPVKLTAGQATLNPAMISDEMNGRGKLKPTVSPDFYNAQGKALGANLDAIRSSVAPEVIDAHPTAHGQALVDAYKSMDIPDRAGISAKYQALKDANGGEFPVAGHDIAAAADQGLKADNVTRFLPPEVKGILDDIREPGKMTFNDFQNYLTILGQQERKAARSGDGTAGHAISIVRNAFESLPMSEDAAHLKPLLDAARGAAKERFDRIASDPAYKAAISDDTPIGEPSPLADKFISGYVTGNNVRGANLAQMKANLANQPGAHQTIAAATLDHLKSVAKVDPETGKFLSDGYGKAITQLSMKLPDMVGPEAAQKLQQVAKVAKYTSAQPKGSYVNNSNTLVGALSAPAAAGLRSMLAVKTMGASEAALAGLGAVKQGKASKQAIAPAAGVNKLMNTPP